MKPNIALVAAVKNEGPYLVEWIAYHLMLGVEHIYLYDDWSGDNSIEAYQTMYQTGRLTVHMTLKTGRRNRTQEDCYEEWRRSYGHLYTFMMPWDADEFLALKEGTTLDEFLSSIPEDVGQIRLNWKAFGSGSARYADFSKYVIERFTKHSLETYSSHVTKLIIRLSAMGLINPLSDESRPITAHCSSILPTYRTVGADLMTDVENTGATITPVFWNSRATCYHYPIKSVEEFITIKKAKSLPYQSPEELEIGSFINNDYFVGADYNDLTDESMFRYVAPLRSFIKNVKTSCPERARNSFQNH